MSCQPGARFPFGPATKPAPYHLSWVPWPGLQEQLMVDPASAKHNGAWRRYGLVSQQ